MVEAGLEAAGMTSLVPGARRLGLMSGFASAMSFHFREVPKVASEMEVSVSPD